ncbi:hypothetical protein N7474_006018 [Penicillium riverlandense]|uniref:uncharacterized protein n=1 Tax=Penicillium riverlandense TaxID=1903569 RepID=UPI00254766FD|nr:uncharacterized protein N7474_006018 [Penicillium riverlandense]KAJ5820427.1 hypothetical protein N7474_006018 [Penicillium riverlandense]
MPSTRSLSHGYAGRRPKNDEVVTETSLDCATSIVPAVIANSPTLSAQYSDNAIPHGADRSPPSAANIAPPEILLQIFSMLTPRDYDNARRTCSQWLRVSLNRNLLERMLKRAGWWDAWQNDCAKQRTLKQETGESEVWRMSRRFATECLLSGRKANVEKPGFLITSTVDFSPLSQGSTVAKTRGNASHALQTSYSVREANPGLSTFSVSSCGNYLLVTTGCMIYVYRLHSRKARRMASANMADTDVEPISRIECPFEVLSATVDTSTPKFVVAAILRNRVGMVCDLNVFQHTDERVTSQSKVPRSHQMPTLNPTSRRYHYNVCSSDHPPRTVAVCPGRRCVAFGSSSGVELHWIDETNHKDQRKHFPMSQPSEIVHFLPNRPETPMELRLISSLAGPGLHECACLHSPFPDHPKKCQFHLLADVQSFTRKPPANSSSLSLVRATHCHHYRAVPINDGFHIMFIEPRTGLLCIGSDAPIGGPTSLTRAFVCVPPFGKDPADINKEARVPTIFAAGSDLNWGLRVVAAYQDRIVLYTVPLDVFNVIRKERERQGDGVMGDSDLARDWFVDSERSRKRRESLVQNQNGDWEFLLSVSYRPTAMMWPFKIYGKEIGSVDNLVELALQSSNGSVRVWAFSASGEASIFDVDTFTTSTQDLATVPCKSLTLGPDGSLKSARLVDRTDSGVLPLRSCRKRKSGELHDTFASRYGPGRRMSNLTHDIQTIRDGKAGNASLRRPSFAACIVDFKIPELGSGEGVWRESSRA